MAAVLVSSLARLLARDPLPVRAVSSLCAHTAESPSPKEPVPHAVSKRYVLHRLGLPESSLS